MYPFNRPNMCFMWKLWGTILVARNVEYSGVVGNLYSRQADYGPACAMHAM
jgi:hypothetical protein